MVANTGNIALGVLIALSIVVPLTILAIVCWLFFRSARRYDRESGNRP